MWVIVEPTNLGFYFFEGFGQFFDIKFGIVALGLAYEVHGVGHLLQIGYLEEGLGASFLVLREVDPERFGVVTDVLLRGFDELVDLLVKIGREDYAAIQHETEVEGRMIQGKLAERGKGLVGRRSMAIEREFIEMMLFVDTEARKCDIAAVTVDVDKADSVGVLLIATDVQRAAGITYDTGGIDRAGFVFTGVAEGLRAMDMAESHIVEATAEVVGVDGLQMADVDIVAGEIGSCYGEVPHENHWFQPAVELRDIIEYRLDNILTRAESEGHSNDKTLGKLDDVVELPTIRARETVGCRGDAYQLDVAQTPDGVVGMDARGGVVVAGSDDYGHVGEEVVEVDKIFVETAFDRSTGLLDVEDVATHYKGVGAIVEAP